MRCADRPTATTRNTSIEIEVYALDRPWLDAYVLRMSGPSRLAELGNIIGDPARAVMLCVLLDGRGHSATELSLAAGVSPQTASWHLAKLADGRLITAEKQGRNRTFRLASRLVARTLEAMMSMAGSRPSRPHVLSEREQALRDARTCYDHFAGRLGVALADAFKKRKLIVLSEDGGLVTPSGAWLFSSFGIDLSSVRQSRRLFCRSCLDWSEQKPHLAGAFGAAFAARCFDLGWVRRLPGTRAVAIAPAGATGFKEQFGVTIQRARISHAALD
jgi:DNA-binding transcriptional ArsR family regulator